MPALPLISMLSHDQAAAPVAPRGRGLRGLLARLLAAAALRRQRARLAELPDEMLDDIGLTRAHARQEADRPLWDAPGHWFR